MKFRKKYMAAAGLTLVGVAWFSTSASAGEWRFHPERCPDLVEDWRDRRESRRDERHDHGPLDRLEDRMDRRESRRDESVTVCPASAWVYAGRGRPPVRPAAVKIYFDPYKNYYYRRGLGGARVKVVIK